MVNENNKDFWSALDQLVAKSEIIIDRPKGSAHPKYNFIYELDYGYLSDTYSQDGQGIDLFKGNADGQGADAIICTIDLLKKDSEIKILFNCTEEEKAVALKFCNESQFMKGVIILRDNN